MRGFEFLKNRRSVFILLTGLALGACSSSGGDSSGPRRLIDGSLNLQDVQAITTGCTDVSICCTGADGNLDSVAALTATDQNTCSFEASLPLNTYSYCSFFTGDDGNDDGACPDTFVGELVYENGATTTGALPIFPNGNGHTYPIDVGTGLRITANSDVISQSLLSQVDSDGDGMDDSNDEDDDGDGTTDDQDNSGGDLILNCNEINGNDDNVPDIFQEIWDFFSSIDTDGDGIPNICDQDTDGDGQSNSDDADDDGDGTIDSQDSDDDGDGIADSGETDTDGDGVSNFHDNDADNDGTDNDDDADDDGDGLNDDTDTDDDGNGYYDGYEDDDTDGDGIPNHYDCDADGDGLYHDDDTDDDGDSIPDDQDSDDDGTGIHDSSESYDPDGDGIPTPYDTDGDGDGLEDWEDDDDDNDGLNDNADDDDNGDGIPDDDQDTNGDGIPDAYDDDVDGDGVDNFTDTDDDGDGTDESDDESACSMKNVRLCQLDVENVGLPDVADYAYCSINPDTNTDCVINCSAMDDPDGCSTAVLAANPGGDATCDEDLCLFSHD